MKWAMGGAAIFLFFYFLGVPIFNAMKKHDYDAIYHGMRDARRSAGAFVQEEDRPYVSYADKYAYGRN
jgi:hypothetical protein